MDVSVVMPCYNEEKTVAKCVIQALGAIKRARLTGEVVVADNGSTDDSVGLARKAGARVVHQPKKGYGNAYQKGFASAKGRFIIMGDSDCTYDFNDIPEFVKYLEQYDVVIGSRLRGNIEPGAMPWLHRYIGNPILTKILNILFKTNVTDAHCGMRGFRKKALDKMNCKSEGMEFASELVINASDFRIKEIPINYYARPGGSKAKLKSFRDGFRHLKFMVNEKRTRQKEKANIFWARIDGE